MEENKKHNGMRDIYVCVCVHVRPRMFAFKHTKNSIRNSLTPTDQHMPAQTNTYIKIEQTKIFRIIYLFYNFGHCPLANQNAEWKK